MRTEVPLREITTEEIWAEVQRLRNELQTHNHLISGSQILDGQVSGIIQSTNFQSRVAGWKLTSNSFEMAGGTITGGTIQTAISGQRIVITSTGLAGYNSAGIQEVWLNASAAESTTGLVLKSATDQTLLHIENTKTDALTKETLICVNRGTGKSAAFFKNYNTASAADTVSIIQEGTGNGLFVNIALSTNVVYAGDFRQAGTGGGIYIYGGNALRDKAHIVIDRAAVDDGTHGDILFPNRTVDPSSGSIGEICVVNGVLKICTAITPVWTVVGTQI